MKCLCGYSQMPNNTTVLARHMQDCMTSGPLKGLVPDPCVVWRDGEFHVVKEPEEGEHPVEMQIVRPQPHVVAVEKKVYAEALKFMAVEEAADTPEEFEQILEKVADGEELPLQEALETLEEAQVEAEEEKPKPVAKKKTPKKKTS